MTEHRRIHDAARKEQLVNAFMGSEFRALLQLTVLHSDEDGSAVLLPAEARVRNGIGTVHGGAVASLIDAACALAGFPYMPSDSFPVTRALAVEYLAPGRSALTASAHVTAESDKELHVVAQVRDAEDTLVARGTARLRIRHDSPIG